ncbi:MAG: preprotein translocase subunit SecG [Candidatus Levybacteria bacterium RIFCSPHIGHO2_01_FULL_36_15]|nr:MAG: preprotein translocase subunit SecG [Candidatus Levybacteria bacterium RIFCSPHIGHO2_01_FULL_36_15]OGH37238.1 MAG: preprotein translocase subunit SecG [Candidatus Levybacteria bacterium RIFCSPLOWO2_01_FULL_36_10]
MKFLTIIQIVISLLLIVSIILQSRGSQVGMAFGGGGETYRSKRGIEKLLFYVTIVLAVLFASASILSLVIK